MLFSFPIKYEEPVFRPPSEAFSLILQITIGCSWNKCAFCEMYSTKKFRVRKPEEINSDIIKASRYSKNIRKIFLADGNAMVLSTDKLLTVLKTINEYFPRLQRVSAYSLPGDILSKSDEELKALHDGGLKLLYVGVESGDDEMLKKINKSETYKSTVDGLIKAQNAGMKNSVMILTGLGGKNYSEQHAVNSARILNDVKPLYASTLALSFPFGEEQYRKRFNGEYISMTPMDLLEELKLFIEHTNLSDTIFRSDHASNYITLKGILPRDKQRFIDEINYAVKNPKTLRPEWMRGL